MGEHTPLPWKLAGSLYPEGNCLMQTLMGEHACVAEVLYNDEDDTEAAANAAFIVRAVNSHYELIEALKGARFVIQNARPDSGALPLIEAVLVRADAPHA